MLAIDPRTLLESLLVVFFYGSLVKFVWSLCQFCPKPRGITGDIIQAAFDYDVTSEWWRERDTMWRSKGKYKLDENNVNGVALIRSQDSCPSPSWLAAGILKLMVHIELLFAASFSFTLREEAVCKVPGNRVSVSLRESSTEEGIAGVSCGRECVKFQNAGSPFQPRGLSQVIVYRKLFGPETGLPMI